MNTSFSHCGKFKKKKDFTTLLKVAQTASNAHPQLHIISNLCVNMNIKINYYSSGGFECLAHNPFRSWSYKAKAAFSGRGVAGDITANLLGWIRHLSAKESQRLEALADGVDVGHSHKHHLTVGVVFCSSEEGKQWFKQNYQEVKTSCFQIIAGRTNTDVIRWTHNIYLLCSACKQENWRPTWAFTASTFGSVGYSSSVRSGIQDQ